jgi:hypothetical protein
LSCATLLPIALLSQVLLDTGSKYPTEREYGSTKYITELSS